MRAISGPNREPKSQNVDVIGCQRVRRGLSFLSLRTVVRALRSCEPCYHSLLVSDSVVRLVCILVGVVPLGVCVCELALVETSTLVRKGYGRCCNSLTACTMVLRC